MDATPQQPTPEELVRRYIELRDYRSAIKKQFTEADEVAEARMKVIQAELLALCQSMGVESVRTGAGTFFRQLKTRFVASDMAEFLEYVQSTGRIDLLERRVGQTAVREAYEETGELPPGISPDSEYTITIRKS